MFDKKATKLQLQDLDEIKADKTQIIETQGLIDNLNLRLKQVAIIQKEMAFNL